LHEGVGLERLIITSQPAARFALCKAHATP
jgi:hypothetical protein